MQSRPIGRCSRHSRRGHAIKRRSECPGYGGRVVSDDSSNTEEAMATFRIGDPFDFKPVLNVACMLPVWCGTLSVLLFTIMSYYDIILSIWNVWAFQHDDLLSPLPLFLVVFLV